MAIKQTIKKLSTSYTKQEMLDAYNSLFEIWNKKKNEIKLFPITQGVQ